jgi:hypothetical protein
MSRFLIAVLCGLMLFSCGCKKAPPAEGKKRELSRMPLPPGAPPTAAPNR